MGESFGKYQLLKRIAQGGMGEVFLARQQGIEGFEKLLVIKTLLPHLTNQASFIQMFLDEARLAARLAHPNVVQIYDLGSVDDTFYIAMEYVHGHELRQVWKQVASNRETFPIALGCRIAAEAAAGLGYAHRMTNSDGAPLGLVHRDVSPHNLLVTFDGGVKVIDFGVAKAVGRVSSTAGGGLKGKYAYMSPEQVDGEEIDARSDIFGLGTVLWELITGSRLFKRDSDVKIMRAVSDCEVVAPSVKNPAVPQGLDAIVLKALAQNREQRYPTMEAFALELEEWLTSTRNSASNAHLGAFMRHQFAEALAREGTKGPLWDVDPAATGLLMGGRPRGHSDTSLRSLAHAEGSASNLSAAPLLANHRPASRLPTVALIAGAIGVAAAAAYFASRGAAPEVMPASPISVTAASPLPVPQPVKTSTPSLTARLKVTSQPSGAKLLDGETPLGTTPADLVLPRSRAAVNLTIVLAGYEPETRGVDLTSVLDDAPTTLDFTLRAVAPVAPKAKVKTARPSVEVKTFE